MPSITNLLNTFNLYLDPDEEDKIDSQEVVDYCARFRVILIALLGSSAEQEQWMVKALFLELVFPS